MKKILLSIGLVATVLALAPVNTIAENAGNFAWHHGLKFSTDDNQFQFKVGGRMMLDSAFYSDADTSLESSVGNLQDGSEFRRARFYMAGLMYGNIEFKAQYDFAGGTTDFKDVFFGITNMGFGHVRVGHFHEPFGLEELTSSKYITFLERGLTGTFTPGRNDGILYFNTFANDSMYFATGVFRETDGFGDSTNENDYNITTRFAATPWYGDDGAKLLHVGIAYSRKETTTLKFSERPESHLAPKFVSTGSFAADSVDLVGLELAVVYDSLSLQSEYISAMVSATGASDPDFSSYYFQASYFLTGEHRNYKRSSATFGRVSPLANFSKDGGSGAWELTARYSNVDLNDSGFTGGNLDDITLGANWYLNPNVRIMFNYVNADEDILGSTSIWQTRFQIDF